MKTYNDLQDAINEESVDDFIQTAISEHKRGELYQEGMIAREYMRKRNITIKEFQKLLYTVTGQAIPDNYSANYKLVNSFFPKFVIQENSYLLGNGVTFNDESTKERLGGDEFDNVLMNITKKALWGGLAFGFFNIDHVEPFDITEFVPLWDEGDGSLKAGIRFWQIDKFKPMRVTLYEIDGSTEYKFTDGKATILREKTPYQVNIATSVIDGIEILDGKNYPSFPIVPLWGNESEQSELVGLREKIDCYDLIQSGFANTIDDASVIYWTINNAGGMDDVDLAKFVERMKTLRASVMDDEGAHAEAHTINIPYDARQSLLLNLRDSIYQDAMALDTEKISAGNVTATAIEASYENLNLKCDELENCVTKFIKGLLTLIGVEDSPSYKRSKIINMAEDTQMILSSAQFLDAETVLKHLPFLSPDEVDSIMEKIMEEEVQRYENEQPTEEKTDTQEAVETASEIKALNGAQTQSLILIIDRYNKGELTRTQAIKMIATAIGVSEDNATDILEG